MLNVSVKVDLSGAFKLFNDIREEQPKAVVRALNKTAITARAQASREIIAAGYGMKSSAIKKQISIRRATQSELTAILNASGRPIPLINYDARQTKAGVTVAVLNGRKLIKSAFIATMKSGHKGVYLRVGSAEEKSMVGRGALKITKSKHIAGRHHGLPIRELFGPSVPGAFVNETVQAALDAVIRERFGVVLRQEMNFLKLS